MEDQGIQGPKKILFSQSYKTWEKKDKLHNAVALQTRAQKIIS